MKSKPLSFASFDKALSWAKKHGNENCHYHHYWRVVKADKGYAVAVLSKNSNELVAYAE